MIAFLARMRPILAILVLVPGLSGCGGRYLVATPHLLQNRQSCRLYADCPASCQNPDMDVVYVTDREVEAGKEGPAYGHGRAKRLAFGVATVELDPRPDWHELVQASTTSRRRRDYLLKEKNRLEMGCFRRTHQHGKGGESDDAGPDFVEETQSQTLHEIIGARLAATDHKDVFVFIHGFNNTFEDGVFRAARGLALPGPRRRAAGV